MRNKETGEVVIIAETKHCFTNLDLKPINLKKHMPEYSKVLEKANSDVIKM